LSSAAATLFVASSPHAVQSLLHRGARAETLSSLRRRLAAKLAPHATLASAEASRMALADVLAQSATPFSAPGGSRIRSVEAFDDAIGALFQAGTTIAMLEQVARKKGPTADRAALLARAMSGVQEALARAGLIDRRCLATELAVAITETAPEEVARIVGAERVVAKSIVHWQSADLSWWRALDAALSRVGGFARLELPIITKKMDAERDRDPLESTIDELAQRLDAAPDTVSIESRFGDLRFADGEPARDIDLRRASNPIAQARAIADAVSNAIASGAHTEEIAIALSDFDDSSIAAIQLLFEEIGIPLHLPRGPSPVDAPVVRAALTALSFVTEEASRVELRALEESPFIRGDVRERLLHARSTHDPNATWRQRISRARALWTELELDAKPTKTVRDTLAHDRARESLDTLELRAHAENSRAWNALHASLDAIEASAARLKIAGRPIAAAEFSRTLHRSLETQTAPPASSLAGAIFLGRLEDVANEPLALLVIADAHEGALPSSSALSPVITESIATSLREIDSARSPIPTHVHHAMTWAALAAASANAQRVVVTYRTQGSSGDALGPSPLVAWLLRAGIPETDWHSGPLAGNALNANEARLRDLAFSEKNRPIVAPTEARLAEIERTREAFHSRRVPSAWVGDVSASAASLAILERATASVQRPLSITALEEFSRCNFRGFARAILGVREPDSTGEAPDARERGELVHEALRAAFEATMPLWSERPRDRDAIRSRSLSAAHAVLRAHDVADEMSSARVALRGVVHRQVIDEMTRILDHSLDDERFDAVHAEQAFGRSNDEQSWAALEMVHAGGAVFLQGEIDRVDVAHDERSRVRAIDYKSSAAVAKDAHRTLGKTTLQVPFYARAAMTALDADRAEGLYLPARDIPAAMASAPRFEQKWEQIGAAEKSREDLAARALAIVLPVRAGNVMPRPHEDDFTVCDRCAYDGICRRPRFVVSEDEGTDEDAG
jgi:RecB family exonuclease